MSQILGTNTFGCAKWIVSATASDGTHTTIAGALTSASSGDTIFVRPGTYTENLTLKAGVSIQAFASSFGSAPPVIIEGKATQVGGIVRLDNIMLKTNGDYVLDLSATANIFLNNCNILASSHAFLMDASSATFRSCNFSDGGAGSGAWFTCATGGTVTLIDSYFIGTTSTVSTFATTGLTIRNSTFQTHITTSGTSVLEAHESTLCQSGKTYTIGGTAGSDVAYNCEFFGGASSAISISAGATLGLYNCVISSSNTNAITGAGALDYSGIVFSGSSSVMNVTTQTNTGFQVGKYRAPLQPAFLAFNSFTDSDVTGDGTVVTVDFNTEVFDQGGNFAADTFTAPVTGKYQLNTAVYVTGLTAANTVIQLKIVTSNRTYSMDFPHLNAGTGHSVGMSILADMDAADTATVTIAVAGSTLTADIFGDGTALATFFSGNLVC